tara:strand:- start:1175 stop:1321 length:147 start_codon:yes stop_codon:yes gene_type:complete
LYFWERAIILIPTRAKKASLPVILSGVTSSSFGSAGTSGSSVAAACAT